MNRIEIKDALDRYREVSCTLWNSNFLPANGCRIDLFDQIEKLLYRSLVEFRVNSESCERFERSKIILASTGMIDDIEIKIGRKSEGNIYSWEEKALISPPEATEFIFMDFFDWDQLKKRKKDLVKVRIGGAIQRENIVGRVALLRWCDVSAAWCDMVTGKTGSATGLE